mmetsp:Transcript_7270/g.9482  ORF Transcript_7270/g.9482 Transcript_7270/m.9482 type:complete len:356 (+) Transcript_7270:98-1165(+)
MSNYDDKDEDEGEDTMRNDDDDDALFLVPVPANRPAGARRSFTHAASAADADDDGNGGGKQRPSIRPSMRLSVTQRRSVRMSLRNLSLLSGPTASASEDEQEAPTHVDGNGTGAGKAVRKQSWYLDMLEQGMTSQDIAAMLGEDFDLGDDDGEGNGGGDGGGSHNNEDTALLEQHAILAHSEAKRRLQERLGYDPWERAAKVAQNLKESPTGSSDYSSSMAAVVFPPTSTELRNNNSPTTVTSVDATTAISEPESVFMWSPQQWVDQPMARNVESDLVMGIKEDTTTTTATSFVSVIKNNHGGAEGNDKSNNNNNITMMVVRCLGCRQSQSVPIVATLVRCYNCLTVSPASSTRK